MADKPRTPRAPNGLGDAGKALWKRIHATFGFDEEPHLVEILEQACRTKDRIAELEEAMEGEPLIGPYGSAKQLTMHPLIPEIRAQQKELRESLRWLRLPDNSGTETMSERNRRAANARWKN